MLEDVEILRVGIIEQVLDELDEAQLAGVASAMADLRIAVASALRDPQSGAHHIHGPQGRD
jgi:hypothetical protein